VLIVEPFGMGDMISHQPLIEALCQNKYDVRVCARREWRSLYPDIQCWVPSQIPWSSYDEEKKYGWKRYASREFRDFFRELRTAGKGSMGVDTRGDIRNVILLYLAGCQQVVTLSSYLGTDHRNFFGAGRRLDFRSDLRRWEINLGFLGMIDAEAEARPKPPRFHRLEQPAAKTRLVGFVAIAPWQGKWWGGEKWSELIAHVRALGWDVTGFCGPNQVEIAASELGRAVPIIECASVEAWAAELQKCSVIVSVDTGPMHLADALGVPVIALFGQGLLPLWAPSGANSRVLSRQDDHDFVVCHPIRKNASFGREFMQRIQPLDVMDALKLLEKKSLKAEPAVGN
jgi:ADP-heptose:LPS heptosyltransferase